MSGGEHCIVPDIGSDIHNDRLVTISNWLGQNHVKSSLDLELIISASFKDCVVSHVVIIAIVDAHFEYGRVNDLTDIIRALVGIHVGAVQDVLFN